MFFSINRVLSCFAKGARNLIFGLFSILDIVVLNFSVSAQNAQDAETASLTADAGYSRVIEVGMAVTLDGSRSTTPSGLQLGYTWSLASKPEGSVVTLSNANNAMPSFTPDVAGDYLAELVVTDSSGISSSASSVLLTTGNVPPVAVAGGDRITTVGQSLRLDPEGTFDANGDRLTAVWSIIGFPSEAPDESDGTTAPVNPGANNTSCPVTTREIIGTYHAVSATSNQQNPHLAVGQPLAEGTTETGSNSATTYYGPITMDLTGDASIFVPEGDVIEIALSSAWDTSARAEILMSADGENYISLGTTGNGGSVYGAWSSNILRYDDFVVPAGGARFLQISHQNSGVRADGVIYQTQCSFGDVTDVPQEEDGETSFASLEEDEGGRFVFTPSVSGEYSVQLTVTDAQGAQSTDVVSIYVASVDGTGDVARVNIAPVANAGFDQVVIADQAVSLDGSQSTDINGDRLTYKWSILSRPAGSFSVIENANRAVTRFTPDTNQTYILQLTVTDEAGLSDYDTIVIRDDSIAPFALSGGPTLGADGSISAASAQVSAQGPQSGTLSYDWSVLGLSAGQGEIDAPKSQSTSVTFDQSSEDDGILSGNALEGLDLFERYSVISFGDLNSNVDTAGATLVGGNVVGGSATFASQLQSQNGTAVLEVVGDIRGGPKNCKAAKTSISTAIIGGKNSVSRFEHKLGYQKMA